MNWLFEFEVHHHTMTSTMPMSGSQPFDQVLSEDFPGSRVSIPSGSLTIHLLSSL